MFQYSNLMTGGVGLYCDVLVDYRKSVEVGVFRRGWVTLSANFRRNGASPTNHCWCQKTKVIALSCGIKISAVHCLVLSQSMRVTDGQTDKRTDGRRDGQNYDSQDRISIAASRGKNETRLPFNRRRTTLNCLYLVTLVYDVVDPMIVILTLTRRPWHTNWICTVSPKRPPFYFFK